MDFWTLENPESSEFKVAGSKFLSFSFPIESEESAKTFVKEFKNKYHDATHVCYAYAIGKHEILKAHDDGEPSYTAGSPILNSIKSEILTQVLLIVVRYFGGTKLGKSGLIQAYKNAAISCLEKSKKLPYLPKTILSLTINYGYLNSVLNILRLNDCKIIEKKIENECTIVFEAEIEKEKSIKSLLEQYQ